MPTIDDLRMYQAQPLELKLMMTQRRIAEWINEFGSHGVYVSFSGGKDSTVLLHIIREMYSNDIPAVFVNTGLEYPEIQQFAKSFENVTVIRPKMRFDEVIKKYGYPFISKQVSHVIDGAQRGAAYGREQLRGRSVNRGENKYTKDHFAKYLPLESVDFRIGENCCSVMKKTPAFKYQKESGRLPFLATMTEESALREKAWLKNGCNVFDAKHSSSAPMSFWTEQDILQYIKENNIPICSVYGDIVSTDANGNEYDYNLVGNCKYRTTGCQRTGCIFCGFGAHLEKGENRFQRLKRTHPKQYEYCMDGGSYDADGIWKPNENGLGMRHCIEVLNSIYGDDFIKID